MTDWYGLEITETTQALGTDLHNGLSSDDAAERLRKHGVNELVERGAKKPWQILFDQFKDAMVVILILAALVSGFLGEFSDLLVILAIVVLNALLGFTQEYRAEKAIAALKKLAVPTVKVRREGKFQEISARELVSGDIVMLEAGNLVPADGRLIESVNLRVQEATLTGEFRSISAQIMSLNSRQREFKTGWKNYLSNRFILNQAVHENVVAIVSIATMSPFSVSSAGYCHSNTTFAQN